MLDLDDLEEALNDGGRSKLENQRLLSSTDRLHRSHESTDDTGVDERRLTQVEDQVVPTLECAVNLVAERWRVRQIELSLETDCDDLVRLGDNADGSLPVLGADR
ncbi:MAG TPA: hypothetical protein VFU84_06465 [Gaiellaceae bacterium]|nr:hypothetical protein [Gaiellaceae bacterium]